MSVHCESYLNIFEPRDKEGRQRSSLFGCRPEVKSLFFSVYILSVSITEISRSRFLLLSLCRTSSLHYNACISTSGTASCSEPKVVNTVITKHPGCATGCWSIHQFRELQYLVVLCTDPLTVQLQEGEKQLSVQLLTASLHLQHVTAQLHV